MTQSQALTRPPLQTQLKRLIPSLDKMLPKHLTSERVIRLAYQAKTTDTKLAQCSDESIVNCVMEAGRLGVEPGVPSGAYLVPFRNKGGGWEAQLIVSYQGLIEIAYRSGKVAGIWAKKIHEHDEHKIREGSEGTKVHHIPVLTNRGSMIGVYACARMKDSDVVLCEWMSKDDVDAIRKRSKAGNSGPWVTDYEAMALKTVIRRLCKILPKTPALVAAIEDSPVEPPEIAEVIDITPQPSGMDKAKEALGIEQETEFPTREPGEEG
jgi:recombination protein RecT